ncbi:cell cycle protein [Ruminiclostridium papyrosolvens DSM 2782]|uniref:Cell cycle protein n=1 Tax=Ruminiclostridium papyrosolvens DSM 2782 TaxID=588581 RepID=F1TGR0_9FIRM|nr:FtsW/RodA/SpoVE family cell cycle protein [Ruminiclostridium papyrosolvens]EGD46391.1 cell cycle protein [Ruminiclostridium papyrosolvens DSM 2782]WES33996.1 FtsW/RodA/SpoVE family cell cycle protein [Ruminiclostridium papyrosolvens DSM 2782]
MNQCAIDFIDIVLGQVKYKKAHRIIQEELQSHIEELTQLHISDGMSEDEAVKKAILKMGDPIAIGKQLHNTHKPKTEWSIVILLGAIVLFGLYVMFQYSQITTLSFNFERQILFVATGIILAVTLYFVDFVRFEKYSLPVYYSVCILLLSVIIFGTDTYGRTIIVVGKFSVTPSFAAIPFLLISYSGLIRRWCDGTPSNLFKLVVNSLLPLIIIFMEPSLMFACILGAGFAIMVTCGIFSKSFKGNRKKTLFILYGGLLGFILINLLYFITCEPYRFKRLIIFAEPWRDPLGSGWMNVMMHKIQSSSPFIGMSKELMISDTKQLILPCSETDCVFTFVVGRFGWLFGAVLLGLLGLIIVRLFMASNRVRNEYGRLLGVGICCVFSIQVIIHILANLNLFPMTGISLPFISYGGQSCVMNMALIGMLLGIYRRKDISFRQEEKSMKSLN